MERQTQKDTCKAALGGLCRVGSVLCLDLLSQSYLGGRTLSAAGVAD